MRRGVLTRTLTPGPCPRGRGETEAKEGQRVVFFHPLPFFRELARVEMLSAKAA
jgi:hypothetical protein